MPNDLKRLAEIRRLADVRRVAEIDDLQRHLLERPGPFPDPGRVAEGGTTDHAAGRPGRRRRPEGDRDDDNFNPDGSRKDRDERKPDYDVGLICRTYVGDVGARPLPNMVFWESPDIWVESSAGDPDIATPGEVNRVKVHVWNMGLADAWGTHIDLYWCDPSVGINPAVAHPIGSTAIPLAAGQHQVVSFDWVPTFVNGGHACLVAQVYDPVSDPVVAPFNPVYDRHVGQRNISVLEVEAGATLSFDFFSQNLSLSPATTLLEIQRLEGEALETVAMALGTTSWRNAEGDASARLLPPTVVRREPFQAGSPFATGVFRETLQGVPRPGAARRVSGALRTLAAAATGDDDQHTLMDHAALAETPHAGAGADRKLERGLANVVEQQNLWHANADTAARLTMPPGHHFKLTLEAQMPREARADTAAVYRVVERTADRITGGITLVVRTRTERAPNDKPRRVSLHGWIE